MENAVLLAADLYQRMYNSPDIDGGSLEVACNIIEEAVMMEQWLVKKYGKDDDSYLDRLEEYERMMVAKYDLRLPQVTEPKEVEFFSIEDDGQGGKQIHVWGYTYTEGDDQGDGPWRNVEYTGFIEPLQEFIDHLNAEENYVDNQLTINGLRTYFWRNEKGTKEVDFVVSLDGKLIPIEAKRGDRVTSVSLNDYIKEFKPAYSIRISQRNFGFENGIMSVPLYAVFCIK